MLSTSSAFIAADQPLLTLAADTLGRAPFATRVARELQTWQGDGALRVSLQGDAGAGKTTLKNFIRDVLTRPRAAGEPATTVVELKPADWADTAHSHSGFLQPLATALSAPSAELADLRARLDAVAAPVVILVDDVDRMAAPSLMSFMRLLETTATWRNVAWLLVFEKNVVGLTLARAGVEAPEEFLRKLVQLELELPEAPEAKLRQQLEAGIERLFAGVTFPTRPRDRWTDFFLSAVWPLFSTPRDVQRFLAGLAFQFDGFFCAEEGVLEVNPTDLAALEALRMFARPVYSELRDTFRRRETRVVRLMCGREEERKEMRLEIDRRVDQLTMSSRHKRAITALLQQLMPPGTGAASGGREDWDRDLRFCSQRHVERYFHLGATADAVPAHRLLALVRAVGDREKLETLLVKAAEEGMLPEVLDRLPALIQGLRESEITIAAVSLCGICDRLPAPAPADTETRLLKLAGELFAQLNNPLKREDIVAALLDDPARLTGPILLLQSLRPRSDTTNGNGTTSLSIEQFRRLLKPAVAKLHEAATSGAIWNSREAGTLIKRWWEWSGEKQEVQRWLQGQVQEPERARTWLRTFVTPSPTSPGREVMVQLEELGQYCDPNTVVVSATQANGDGVDRAAAKRLTQVLASKGTSVGFAVRSVTVALEPDKP